MSDQLYPTIDPAELEPEYSEHLKALPKVFWGIVTDAKRFFPFFAAQLALRDLENKRLKELIEEKAGDLALERCARIEQTCAALQRRMREAKALLRSERDAALARVRELELREALLRG